MAMMEKMPARAIHGCRAPNEARMMSAMKTRPTMATSVLWICWGRVRAWAGAVRMRSQSFFLRRIRVEVS